MNTAITRREDRPVDEEAREVAWVTVPTDRAVVADGAWRPRPRGVTVVGVPVRGGLGVILTRLAWHLRAGHLDALDAVDDDPVGRGEAGADHAQAAG